MTFNRTDEHSSGWTLPDTIAACI